MLTFSLQLYVRWALACYGADFGKQANYDIAPNTGISVWSVETIIHKHSLFNKVCALWVPKKWTFNRMAQHIPVPAKHLCRFELEGNTFLEWTVACDEMLVLYFTPELKQSSMEWRYKGSPTLEKFKTQLSAGKIMASVFGIWKEWFMLIVFHMVLQ